MSETKVLQVFSTFETREDAERIAGEMVERRLAACAQVIGPITSVYHWQGKIEKSPEFLCLLKTTEERYGALEAALRAAHPYETPEILAAPVTAGAGDYIAWLAEELGRAE